MCTIGPASASPSMLVRMMRSGMDVARLNFSHGTHAEHARYVRVIRAAARKAGKYVAIIQDLQGPKIRVGSLPEEGVTLHKGELLTLTSEDIEYEAEGPVPVTYNKLYRDVAKGHRILFDDGTIEVVVEKVRAKHIAVRVRVPGTLKSHKGMNLPDSDVSAEPFTAKDREDLLFGVSQGVDWVAMSFVSCGDDVRTARAVAKSAARAHGVRTPFIFAKVERRSALDNLSEIIQAADGILLGRGDLGVEIPPEEVPVVQKDVVEACRKAGKPVIVATQMLNSMVDNPRGTRAETSDVANAVFDHTDAVMLSAESATGRYPAVTVQAMAAVVREAEHSRYDDIEHIHVHVPGVAEALAQSAHVLAASGIIGGIVTSAAFGSAARCVGMYRPSVPIYVVASDESLARQLVVFAGITPLVMDDSAGSLLSRVSAKIRREGLVPRGLPFAYLEVTPTGSSLRVVER